MAKNQAVEMPFLDHLEELRWRIIWSLLALAVGIAIAFYAMLQFNVITLLEKPIAPYLQGQKLVYTHPGDAFSIVLSTSFALGLVLALPMILYQAWAFISPALYQHERRVVIPVIAGAMLLFAAGVSLVYFVVLPLSIGWLMGFQTESLQPMITARAYFGFATTMAITFGLCFELPIVILALAALGVVTPAMLVRFRRHAFVACVVAGAFLSPGDLIWTTVALSVPLYFLYELSVGISRIVYRRRARRAAREGAPDRREQPA